MSRTLVVTLSITVDHLEGEDLEQAREGMDEEYPAGEDADLDETSPDEIANIIAETLPHNNDEMWAGSMVFAKISDVSVVTANWA